MLTPPDPLHGARYAIAERVRQLRKSRRWTQEELAKHLGLSQNRLSEIERGDGSFTAEQFLEILRLFNVELSYFGDATSAASDVQNALARLGARHLYESSDVLPSSRLKQVSELVRETLVEPRVPRHVAALAPVILRNADSVNLHRLQLDLATAGLEGRLPWLVENVLDAIHQLDSEPHPRAAKAELRRAHLLLGLFLDACMAVVEPRRRVGPKDILDPAIRSLRTLHEVEAESSPISKRWSIVTSLQPDDFLRALREADAHR